MGISDLRRWHWMVVGVLLGLIIGYSLNAIGTDALISGARSAKTSQTSFESELIQDPLQGADGEPKPFITKLVVHPDGPIDLLKFQRLVNLQPDNRNSKQWEYQTWYYEARKPYSPLLQWEMRTDVRVKPDFPADRSLGGHPAYTTDEGWRDADGVGKMYRDPGAGLTIYPAIAKGTYDVVFRLDDAKQAADLIAKFNGHLLAPLTVDPTDPHYFHTTIPVADFDAQNARDLFLARKDVPIHIGQIHIYNPTYTVRDYLDAVQAQHPQMQHYRYAWWYEPKAQLWLAVGICFVLIGVIWPTVVGLLVGAGFGPPPREKGVSLRNLKATPAPSAAVAVAPTEADLASLQQMEEDLLKELESEITPGAAAGPSTPAGPAPVMALNAKAVEPTPLNAPKKQDTPKTFKGEFYPVARKAEVKDKDDATP